MFLGGILSVKIIVCDDEQFFVDCIKHNVDLFLKEKNIDAEFFLYTDCKYLKNNNNNYFDIAFLDIEMGEMKGTQVAEILKAFNPNIIVFIITSHDQYLDEAMDLNVFRYIKKPLDIKRLFDGLEKAVKLLDETVIEFYVKNDDSVMKVTSSDILYVEIINHATRVVTLDGEYVSKNNIDFWTEKLSASFFFQPHYSFIINMKHITKYDYEQNMITLNDMYKVPVSTRMKSAFKKYFLEIIFREIP